MGLSFYSRLLTSCAGNSGGAVAIVFLGGVILGSYKLMNDLNVGQEYIATNSGVTLSLDLGGNTLTTDYYSIAVEFNSNLTLSNGTIKQTDDMLSAVNSRMSTLTVSNCTLIGCNYYALYVMDSTVTVKNSVLTGGVVVATVYEETATLIAADNVTVTAYDDQSASGVGIGGGGVMTVGFNPESLLSGYNEGGVTDNGDGT